ETPVLPHRRHRFPCRPRQLVRRNPRPLQSAHASGPGRRPKGTGRLLDQQGRAAVGFGAYANQASSDACRRGSRGRGARGQVSAEAAGTGVRAVVEVLAKALADSPDEVRVTETQHQKVTLIELYVSPRDI